MNQVYENQTYQINVSYLPKGNYLISIHLNRQEYATKMIKE